MKLAIALSAAALAVTGCSQENTENASLNDDMVVDEAATPETGNLTIDSDPAAVDRAINQTDQQSNLGNAAEDVANSAGNAVE